MIRFPNIKDWGNALDVCQVQFLKNGSPEITDIRLQADTEGFYHWTCRCTVFARTKWCEHVQHACIGDVRGSNFCSSPAIVVFSKEPWLIIPCVVEQDERTRMSKVMALWGDAQRSGPDSFDAAGYEVIGFTNPDYTRKEIRRLLLEWLPSIPDTHPQDMTCKATFHDPDDNISEWVQVLKSANPQGPSAYNTPKGVLSYSGIIKKVYTDVYTLLDVGQCVSCFEAANLSMDLEY